MTLNWCVLNWCDGLACIQISLFCKSIFKCSILARETITQAFVLLFNRFVCVCAIFVCFIVISDVLKAISSVTNLVWKCVHFTWFLSMILKPFQIALCLFYCRTNDLVCKRDNNAYTNTFYTYTISQMTFQLTNFDNPHEVACMLSKHTFVICRDGFN